MQYRDLCSMYSKRGNRCSTATNVVCMYSERERVHYSDLCSMYSERENGQYSDLRSMYSKRQNGGSTATYEVCTLYSMRTGVVQQPMQYCSKRENGCSTATYAVCTVRERTGAVQRPMQYVQ